MTLITSQSNDHLCGLNGRTGVCCAEPKTGVKAPRDRTERKLHQWTLGAAAVIAGLTLGAPQAHAALLAEESFDYEVGDLAGHGPGNGFGGNTWSEAGLDSSNAVQVVENSLNFSSGPYTAGNRASFGTNRERATLGLDTSPGGTFANAGLVDGSDNIGADGTSVYISYLFQANEVKDYLGLEGYRDGARAWFLGRHGDQAEVQDGSLSDVGSFGAVNKNSEDLYVLKIDFLDGGDQITGWLSPTPGENEGSQTPDFSNVSVGDFSFDAVAMWDNAAGSPPDINFDEIRIGTTYKAVSSDTFTAVVPEPASLALLMTGGLLMLRRRTARG
ncbi:MAG: PEP-CTERM sorting domain-containing protein [Phycisphaeraceae bacterium]